MLRLPYGEELLLAVRHGQFGLLGGFAALPRDPVHHKAGCSHPQDNEGDLAVFLVIAWRVEVRELGLGAQGTEVFSGDVGVLADCRINIAEGLD